MLIKDETFRNLFLSYIVIKDEDKSKEMAKFLEFNKIDTDNADSDELRERIDAYELSKKVNSLVAIPYVDHTRGLSFLSLAVAYMEDDELRIYDRENFSSMLISRRDYFENSEFVYLENIPNVFLENFDFSKLTEYAKNHVSFYNSEESIFALRYLEYLDNSRNEEFPDDILVIFIKEGFTPEGMWVRYKEIDGAYINGVLLNIPNQDLGVKCGDNVKFTVAPNDNDEYICVCVLN